MFRFVLIVSAKTLSKIFSMATATFFGRVPSKDDSKVSLVGLISLYWIFIAVGVAVPELAQMIIPFAPENETIVFWINLALFIFLPITAGAITCRVENRKHEKISVKQLLMGYPYAFLIGVLALCLIIIVPLIRFPQIINLRSLKHFAIMIKKDKYDLVFEKVQELLTENEVEVYPVDPPKYLWVPFLALIWVQEHIFKKKMAKNMKIVRGELEGEKIEVILHSTDISIIGPEKQVMVVMGILAEGVEERHLYFSWDDSSQKIEDRIYELRSKVLEGEDVSKEEVDQLVVDLRSLSLAMDDWNAIRRQIYRLERDRYKMKCKNEEEIEQLNYSE
ncbi:hypothetical protein ACFPU1_14860 [Thalassorhabdus alkalitolerans]|uniref:Uncharacterized protein n=1 Tax=Thalassorhabdus alkalitolerans TaxID=2282697 RepID=A0ABW0YNJ2_9BACI